MLQALFTLVSTLIPKQLACIWREDNTICPPVGSLWSCETELPGNFAHSASNSSLSFVSVFVQR